MVGSRGVPQIGTKTVGLGDGDFDHLGNSSGKSAQLPRAVRLSCKIYLLPACPYDLFKITILYMLSIDQAFHDTWSNLNGISLDECKGCPDQSTYITRYLFNLRGANDFSLNITCKFVFYT